MESIKTLFGIVGPTASGKTALAINICQRIGGEIISADSMQLYKGMDILSAKPNENELKLAKHHMIGVVSPNNKYNAYRYQDDASDAVEKVFAKGIVPLICGGTGLYIDALTKGISMAEPSDNELREKLKQTAAQPNGSAVLYETLKQVDPISAQKYNQNDVRRVIRSLEIYYLSGKPRGEREAKDSETQARYNAKLFALKWNRQLLYDRIDRRVDEMLRLGLVDEVKSLLNADEIVQETAAQAIGFKEIKLALEGEIDMDEAIRLTKLHSRHLAKRQETWFRRDSRVKWFDTDGNNLDEIAKIISEQITEEYRNGFGSD